MLLELLGPSGAGKTFFLKKFESLYENIIFSEELRSNNIKEILKKINPPSSKEGVENLEDFTNLCIDIINRSSMRAQQKLASLKILLNSYNTYQNATKLDRNGYLIVDDELMLHRAFSFLIHSTDFYSDTKKFFEIAPLPNFVCLCVCGEDIILQRAKAKPNLPNCYKNKTEDELKEAIKKSLEICKIAEDVLAKRGCEIIKLNLSENINDNLSKLKQFLDEKIEEYKNNLSDELLETSGSFNKKGKRHFLKTKNVYYCSFETKNFKISEKDSQRNSQKRFERFEISKKSLKNKTVLDLGSNCGAMLFQASNYEIKSGLGIEYDADKVILSNKIASLSKLNNITFKQGNIDKLDANNMEKYDVVFALAIEAHVNNQEHLYQLLSDITKDVLYFEGNSNCNMKFVENKLKELGFHKIKMLGNCNDDILPKNNTRPMLKAIKKKNLLKKLLKH